MNKKSRYFIGFTVLLTGLCILFFVSLISGSVRFSFSEVIDILSGNSSDISGSNIIFRIRLPRITAALILGGALSVSGFLLQTVFSNPIAGPFILGISASAKLASAIVMIFLGGRGRVLSSVSLVISAFVGSMISMGFILMISGKIRKMSVLIISGVMNGYICYAVTDIIVTFADDSNIVKLHNWSMGT
ncbi:MAG: iron ABC transporter permease, partial [Ruminococcus sp.]|nr:iron ABC transporter permease [Ruminococcus sp.]